MYSETYKYRSTDAPHHRLNMGHKHYLSAFVAHDREYARSCRAVISRKLLSILPLVLVVPSAQVQASESDTGESQSSYVMQMIDDQRTAAKTAVSGQLDPANPIEFSERIRAQALETVIDSYYDSFWLRGDLTAAGVDPGSSSLFVAATVAMYENPYSSNWRYGETGVVWDLDTNLDSVRDYTAVYSNVFGDLYLGLYTSSGTLVCSGTPLYDAVSATYYGTFPISCLPNTPSLRWRVALAFEDYFTATSSFDMAPDSGWGPTTANSGYIPPTPPPTPPPPPPAPPGSGFTSVVPARLLETRTGGSTVDGTFNAVGLRSAGTVTELPVQGRGGVSGTADAVTLNVTVVDATGPGFITVFPCGSAQPNASNLNYTAGQTIPNAVVTKIGTGGKVCLFTLAPVHLIVDVNGYFAT
jgi:hypothetical protein